MKNRFPFSVQLAGWLTSAILIVYVLYVLQDILKPIAFSVLFAVMLYPLCHRLERWHISRAWSIAISLVVLFIVLGTLVYLASVQISNFDDEIPKLTEKATIWTQKTQTYISENFHLSKRKQVTESKKYMDGAIKNGASFITTALSATTDTLTSTALVPLFVFFLLLYRDFFRQFIYQLFSPKYKRKVDVGISRIYGVVQSYLVGLVLVILIVGLLNSAGLLLLGVDYAIFFGFFAAFLLLIPYIGLMIGSLLPALMALITKDSPMYALGVLGIFGVVQVLEGNFITPYIVGSKVSVNPLAAMITLILGGQLWGVAGLILALPVTAILKVIFDLVEPLKPFGYLIGEAKE
jgi:putative heme transporter